MWQMEKCWSSDADDDESDVLVDTEMLEDSGGGVAGPTGATRCPEPGDRGKMLSKCWWRSSEQHNEKASNKTTIIQYNES